MIRCRRRLFGLVAGTWFVLAATVFAVAMIRDSARAAAEKGLVSERGYEVGWLVQADGEATWERLRGLPVVTMMSVVGTSVTYGSRSDFVEVRVLSDARPNFGVLVEGRFPSRPGEVALSRRVASSLGVGLNDRLLLGAASAAANVVGVTVNPADRFNRSAVMVDERLLGAEPVAAVVEAANDGGLPDDVSALGVSLTVTSTRGVLDTLAHSDSGPGRPLKRVPLVLFVALLVVPLSAAASLRRTAETDVRAMIALGLTSQRSWAVVQVAFALAAYVGTSLGVGISALTIWRGRDRVGLLFGQDWVSVQLPLAWLLVLSFTPGLVVWNAPTLVEAAKAIIRSSARARSSIGPSAVRITDRLAFALFGSGCAFIVWSRLTLRATRGAITRPMLGVLLVGAGAVMVISVMGRSGLRRPALANARRSLRTFVRWSAAAAIGLAAAASFYVTVSVADSRRGEEIGQGNWLQPSYSFLVESIDSDAAEKVVTSYFEVGGTDVGRYRLLEESELQIRVTDIEVSTCIDDGGRFEECASSAFPLGDVAVEIGSPSSGAPDGPPAQIRFADEFSLPAVAIEIALGTNDSRTIGTITGTIDPRLGNNLPSVVLPPGTFQIGEELLRLSETERLAFFDFGRLSDKDQALIRSRVASLAPGSLTSEVNPSRASRTALGVARTVRVVSAFFVGLVLAVSGAAVLLAARPLRRQLGEAGASAWLRIQFGLGVFAPLMVGSLVAALASAFAAAAVGRDLSFLGVASVAPLLVAGLVGLGLSAAFATVPPSDEVE
jgi:hypothetical protein